MGYEKKEGDIAVFFNPPEKKKNPNSPDWTGEALIDGKVMRVAFWSKTGTMLAGKIEAKQVGDGGSAQSPANPVAQTGHYAYGESPAAPSGYSQSGYKQRPETDISEDDIPF